MKLSNAQIKDDYDRSFYEKPQADQFYVFNRTFKFTNSNTSTHCNDLYSIFQSYEENDKPKILGLLSDNGPDFNPGSSLVFYYMGQLWKDLNLDQLILCSYAPRSSRYNPIEMAWGTLSQSLAQITLCADHNKYDFKNKEEDLLMMLNQAQSELKNIWSKITYAKKKVICYDVKPKSEEIPYNDYAEIKDYFQKNKKSGNSESYQSTAEFFITHCKKKKYYLHFSKCLDPNCNYCSNHPIKNQAALNCLKFLDSQLPVPLLLEEFYAGKHFPSFLDIMNNESLQSKYLDLMKKDIKEQKESEKICQRCNWYFESNSDSKRHYRFCKRVLVRTGSKKTKN